MTSNSSGQMVSFSYEKIKAHFLVKEGDRRIKEDNVETRNPLKMKANIIPISQISFAPGMKGLVPYSFIWVEDFFYKLYLSMMR